MRIVIEGIASMGSSQRFDRWIALLGLLALGLPAAGCIYHPAPATVPMRSLEISAGAPGTRCLVVFLAGRGDTPEHFVRNGFPEKLRQAGSGCATMGADAHLGYFFERTIDNRLREDVIAPAKARGFEEIWLVGISLGGFGSLLYTKEHPGEIAGIVAIAPYLGDRELTDEIADAGGLDSWTPSGDQPPQPENFPAFWSWLEGYEDPEAGHPPLFLAYGRGDRFARANGLVAELLPGDHVFQVRGGHTWAAWRRAWDAFLASPHVPGRAAPSPSLPRKAGEGAPSRPRQL